MGTVFEAKENCMKMFKRWFANMCREAWENAREEANVPQVTKASRLVVSRDQDWQDNLNIAITAATGGKIVTFKRYDHRTDRHENRVYVIPEEHNFNEELAKLITMESMRLRQ
jgi:hypothetical protein